MFFGTHHLYLRRGRYHIRRPPRARISACAKVTPDLTSTSHFKETPLSEQPTAFELIGGADAIDAIVERFYQEMDVSPAARELRARHAKDLAPTKFVHKRYLTEWLGGPRLYSRDRGHPRLRMRHLRFSIGDVERDCWLACTRVALSQKVLNAELREGIFTALALADHMRNRPGLFNALN